MLFKINSIGAINQLKNYKNDDNVKYVEISIWLSDNKFLGTWYMNKSNNNY